jgi:hypothetical protein
VHEQQVDIGGVVQLAAAPLAEGDHGQVGWTRRVHAGVGDVADLPDDGVDRSARQVTRRDPEDRPTPEAAEARDDAQPVDVGRDLVLERSSIASGGIANGRPFVRVPHEEITGGGREAEEPDHVLALQLHAGVAHAFPRDARELGIGCEREPLVQHLALIHADPDRRRANHSASTNAGKAIASKAPPPATALRSAAWSRASHTWNTRTITRNIA